MVSRISAPPKYVDPYLQNLNPDETHRLPGDCINPKCDYQFTDQDKKEIDQFDGNFTCPKCDNSYNYYYQGNRDSPGGFTHSGLTMTQQGTIGEEVVETLANIPGVGDVTWASHDYQSPCDFIIGPYAVEVKTNHSEATPRFKLGKAREVEAKRAWAVEHGLQPALIGVRLNFYTDKADIFFRPGFTDTWIGNPQLKHVATVDFSSLNPYKRPEDVPPPSEMPNDDSDIPF